MPRSYKLPARYTGWVVSVLLSCFMSGAITLFNLVRMHGWHEGLWSEWFTSWMMSWAIAFPTVLVMAPLARYVARLIVEPPPAQS